MVALRLILLVAVLVQFAPMRLCALEVAALGASCHDESGTQAGGHGDEQKCGSSDTPRCVCEQPKGVSDQQTPIRIDLACEFFELAVVTHTLPPPTAVICLEADSHGDPPDTFQLPLLI